MRQTPHQTNLGDLELAVLDYLWPEGPSDVKAVHQALGRPRGITLHTIQSTLKRLYDKGLLSRYKISHAYVYVAAVSREAFQQRALHEVVDMVMDGEPDAMLSAFVDLAARAGPEQLQRLERLVEERLRDERGAKP